MLNRRLWMRFARVSHIQTMASVTSSVKALNAYLKHSRASFLKYHATRTSDGAPTRRLLHIVMGNEALDLDSIVSSVLLANLYHHHYMGADSLPDRIAAVDVLPILPIERRDLVLRQEAQALLSQVGVDIPSLIFLDDAVLPATSVRVRPRNLIRPLPSLTTDTDARNPLKTERSRELPKSWSTSRHDYGPQCPRPGVFLLE